MTEFNDTPFCYVLTDEHSRIRFAHQFLPPVQKMQLPNEIITPVYSKKEEKPKEKK